MLATTIKMLHSRFVTKIYPINFDHTQYYRDCFYYAQETIPFFNHLEPFLMERQKNKINFSTLFVAIGITISTLLISCSTAKQSIEANSMPTQRNQTTETLYTNLKKLVDNQQIMFGCANPTTLKYVETHIYEGFNSSDCKDITGSNPAFLESDFMWHIKDSLKIADIEASKRAFKRGAVVGYCWHLRGKNSNTFYSKVDNEFTSDKELVKKIVSGKSRSENPELDWLLSRLDSVVIPVIKEFGFPIVFRPWHEMNGSWFWWGSANCTPEEYIRLYRLTVDYIRSKGITNVLYAWSPDTRFTMEYYPGDEYVDILGLDIYEPGVYDWKPASLVLDEMGKMTDYAIEHGKVAALTETGLRKNNDEFVYAESIPDFWTKYILEPILNDAKAKRIAWIECWYGADWGKDRNGSFYIPYLGIEKDRKNGQQAIDDFVKFYKHPATIFEDDLPEMY